MPSRRAIEVRTGDGSSQKWRVSLAEGVFDSFVAHGGAAARRVFGEGSLFSPLLFGKFFDPGDAFPLWEFEADALLAGLRNASKTGVDWFETDSEYALKAELPVGVRKCDAEVCGQSTKVIEISGLWRGKESEARDWKLGRWWEHGFVRQLELPANANWKKTEAHIVDDTLLEIKIPKHNTADGNLH
ncbi:22.3 kDa class VI heat shock protein-like [Zingiber officinale]|uniref:22.3 kDa class VI heat shock protein-like n=1 Tax=Zingiber officinale TaxID=94328 RepID=UPI001C4C51C4|nr:22.3 kDa class VI heat shock protein-like [Zingiber officinale]